MQMEEAFKDLGRIMFEATSLLCTHVDATAAKQIAAYRPGTLFNTISVSQKAKGRLLYYYPNADTKQDDGWIGWHNDSGFLTALTCDMYFNDDTGVCGCVRVCVYCYRLNARFC
jgi:hypothetical protein